jgi:hypothetical protein
MRFIFIESSKMPERSTYIKRLFEECEKFKTERLPLLSANTRDSIQVILEELLLIASISEEETDQILEYANHLNMVVELSDKSVKDPINNIAIGICEAVSFQDLNCQRISKIVMLLEKVIDEGNHVQTDSPQTIKKQKTQNSLLNGPQNPKDAQTQAFVDSYFD